MKKITKKILLISILSAFIILNTNRAFALKRAVFPNNNSLQPQPTDSTANVSGNINHTTSDGDKITFPNDNSSAITGSDSNQAVQKPDQNPAPAGKKSSDIYSILSLIVFMIIVSIVVMLKKNKGK